MVLGNGKWWVAVERMIFEGGSDDFLAAAFLFTRQFLQVL